MWGKTGLLITLALSCLLITDGAAQEVKRAENKSSSARTQQTDKIYDQLNLTADQKLKLKEAKETNRQEVQTVAAALREKRKNLQVALKDPAATRASVLGIANEVKSLQAKQIDLKLDGVFMIKDILTPAQYKKLLCLREEWVGKKTTVNKKANLH